MHKLYDSSLKQWTGPPRHSLFNPRTPLGKVLLHSLSRNPSQIAHIYADHDTHVTFSEVKLQAVRVAQNLRALGLHSEDVVSVIAYNIPQITAILLGCALAGVPFDCLDENYDEDTLARLLGIVRPKLIVCFANKLDLVKQVLLRIELTADVRTVDGPQSVEELFDPTDNEENFEPDETLDTVKSLAFVTGTSGTTGLPKMACISQAQVLGRFQVFLELKPGDVVLLNNSPAWVSVKGGLLLSALYGATLVFTEKPFSPENQARIIEKYRVTNMQSIAPYTLELLSYIEKQHPDLSSVKVYFTGGSKLFHETKVRLEKLIPNAEAISAYGSAEAFLLTRLPKGSAKKVESVGPLAVPDTIKVVDYDGRRLGPNETGEICLKHEFPFSGYLMDGSVANETFDAEGFFRTGDMGYFDDDGFLYLEGRMRDFVRCQKYMYSAIEIERVLLEKLGLERVCVVALEHVELIEIPAAAVVRPEGFRLSEQQIQEEVAKLLPPWQHLVGGVFFVEELPYTLSGKIKRFEVKKYIKTQLENKN